MDLTARAVRVTAFGVLLATLAGACTILKRCAYEGFGRDRWQRPEEVVRLLEVAPGQRVADLGAGGGYFTFRLADAVGPTGAVYAVDVDEGMVGYLRTRAADEGRANVEVVLASPDDARLPSDGVDLVFTCNTYHHLSDRTAYFARLRSRLRPGGRVAVVEYSGEGGWLARWFGHATEPTLIRRELEAAGYRLARQYALPRQSFQVFVVD
jgi:predicted methyltransferase